MCRVSVDGIEFFSFWTEFTQFRQAVAICSPVSTSTVLYPKIGFHFNIKTQCLPHCVCQNKLLIPMNKSPLSSNSLAHFIGLSSKSSLCQWDIMPQNEWLIGFQLQHALPKQTGHMCREKEIETYGGIQNEICYSGQPKLWYAFSIFNSFLINIYKKFNFFFFSFLIF